MGKVFVSFDFIPDTPYLFTMSIGDGKPNIMLFNAIKNYNFWKKFLFNFHHGLVFYENHEIKYNFLEMMKNYNNY